MAALFQLTLELSNVFPVQELVTAATTETFTLARTLRLSGSDLVVEEDLAKILGRGFISNALEKAFKSAVSVHSFTPLSNGCPIALEAGSGPTMRNALEDRRYFATMITLSMLAYFHEQEHLASMLAASMQKRFELKVNGSSPNPGIEGIMDTIVARSSQSSAFHWSNYRAEIEARLHYSNSEYRFSIDYLEITESLLFGAMDYLYIVQRWPEDRKVTISNEKGCIPLIIWAHYLLGLVVIVHNAPSGDAMFSQSKP